MYLKKITMVVITGMIVSFSARIYGTVFPQIYKNLFVVKATILIHVLFLLSHLLFWLVFFSEYISTKKASLKKVGILAIAGSFSVTVVYMKKLPLIFDLHVQLPLFVVNPYFDAVVPLIGSAFHLIFFIAFKKTLTLDEKPTLNTPIRSIIIGNTIYIFLHLIVLFNFLSTDTFKWLEHMPKFVAIGTVPFIMIAVSLILFFYVKFYFFLDSLDRIKTGNRRSP